jgi:hypothetical protein
MEIFEDENEMVVDSKSNEPSIINVNSLLNQNASGHNDILIDLGPKNEFYLIIYKKNLNMESGEKILSMIEDTDKKPRKEILNVPVLNEETKKKKLVNNNNNQHIHLKTQAPNKLTKSTDNKVSSLPSLSTQNIKSAPLQEKIKKNDKKDIDFYDKNSKIERLKMTYKEFFLDIPRCDICAQTGITLPEIHSKNNKNFQIDSFVLDYLLLTCVNCKVFVHKNCLDNEIPKKNNILDKTFEWKCERCLEFLSKVNLISNSNNNINCNTSTINSNCNLNLTQKWFNCQICLKTESELKKPHYFKQLDNNIWVHFICFMWITDFRNNEDNLSFQDKLNNISASSKYNNNCYVCKNPNDSKYFFL